MGLGGIAEASDRGGDGGTRSFESGEGWVGSIDGESVDAIGNDDDDAGGDGAGYRVAGDDLFKGFEEMGSSQ